MPRRGVALLTVLLALMLIGAITAGSLHTILRDQRSSREMLGEQRVLAAAQNALSGGLAAIEIESAEAMPTGAERLVHQGRAPGVSSRHGVVFDSVALVRLTPRTWLLSSVAYLDSGRARRQIALLLERLGADVSPAGALTFAGRASFPGAARIDASAFAADSSCADDSLPAAGIVTRDRAGLAFTPCASGDCIRGVPPILDSGGADPAAAALGAGGWAGLAELADGATVTLVRGDARLDSGSRSGILLVEGDLELGGDFEFRGLVVVLGALRTGGNPRVVGAVVVAGAGRASEIAGSPDVRYSRCAVKAAIRASTRLARVLGRNWSEVF